MENNKYYIIHSKNMAITISNLIGEDFMTFDDIKDKSKKVYSFRNTNKLQIALKDYTELVNKFRKMSN